MPNLTAVRDVRELYFTRSLLVTTLSHFIWLRSLDVLVKALGHSFQCNIGNVILVPKLVLLVSIVPRISDILVFIFLLLSQSIYAQ